MKRFLIGLSVLIALCSCEVVNPHDAPTMNKNNISEFCDNVFSYEINERIKSFHQLYYIGKFIEAGPEEQVSAKYDEIRTNLRKGTGSYSFNSMSITYSKELPFTVGSVWTVNHNYRRKETITMRSENEWKLESSDGVTILITVISADDAGMKLNVQVKGEWTEESSYRAKYRSEDIDVEIINKNPIALDTCYYSGLLEFDFYKKNSKIMHCDMTLRAGTTSIYDIYE